MSLKDLIPVLGVFTVVALLIFACWLFIASYLNRRRGQQLAARLGDAQIPLEETETLAKKLEENRDPGLGRNFRRMVERSTLDLSPEAALLIILLCGFIPATIIFFLRYDNGAALALPTFLVGAAIPFFFFVWRQRRHRQILKEQLPDALFLLARTLRAGRTLEQAFLLVGDHGNPPLANEFNRMYRQLELGIPPEQVMHGASARLNLVDFNVFASVVSLHRTTGGNLPGLLDRLAISSRDRVQFEAQYRATTVMGRYSAGFIGFLACVIMGYLFFYQHEMVTYFFDTSVSYTGFYLFCSAVGLELTGVTLLYFMLKHDY